MKNHENGRRKGILILIFLVFAVLITADFTRKLNTLKPYGFEKATLEKEVPLSGLEPGDSLVQEIPLDGDLAGVSVSLNVYERGNGGTLRMTAAGSPSGKVLAEERFAVSGLTADNRADLLLQEEPEAGDDKVILTMTVEDAAPLLTAWATEADAVADASLTVKGETQAGDLVFRRILRTPQRYAYVTVVYVLMMAAAACGLILLCRDRIRPERLIFALTVMVGLLYMLAMVPLSIPDEQVHYQASYKLSSVMMFRSGDMDRGENVYFDYHGLGGHTNPGSGYDRIAEEIIQPKPAATGEKNLPQRLDYPLMYAPQAFGITLGRIFGANFVILFWLGRLANLLFYAACVSLAVRAAPRFRGLLGLTGLMPMALHQAASYSYDAFINGLALLLIALILRAMDRKERMGTREYLELLAVSMLMAPAKAVYTPILALMLLIPVQRFRSGKRKALMIAYLWAAALIAVAIFQLSGIRYAMNSGRKATNWQGSTNYTLSYLAAHPGETIRVFLDTLRTNLTEWPEQAVGSRLSGLSLQVTGWKITAYMILLLAAAQRSKENEIPVTGPERGMFFLAFAATVFLVMLTMLLNWTSQEQTLIQGIQGRYFIPVAPLLAMCLNNRMIRLDIRPERILLGGALAIHLAVLSGVLRATVLI